MLVKKTALSQFYYLDTLSEKDPILPINKNTQLQYDGTKLILVVNTGSYQVVATISGDAFISHSEPFDVGVDTTKFFSTIKAIDSEVVKIGLKDNTLKIKGASLLVSLATIPGNELTPRIEISGDKTITYKYSTLAGIGKLPSFTTATSAALTGVFIVQSEKKLNFYATDRVVVYRISTENEGTPYSLIVPKELVSAVAKLNLDDESEIAMGSHNNGSGFIFKWFNKDGTPLGHITSRVIAGSTPNFTRVLDNVPTVKMVVNAKELTEAVKLYLTITDIGNITLKYDTGGITIDSADFIKKLLPITSDATNTEQRDISLDSKRLISVLTSIDGENITLAMDTEKPYIMVIGDKDTIVLSKVRRF